MDFIKQYNEATSDKKGQIIPVVITIYEDHTFSFITKLPPVTEAIKSALKIKTGSGKPNKEKVGKLSKEQLQEIAKNKIPDLNTKDLKQAVKIVTGTAKSMGVEIIN
jgi:large subunit ribosomal protein L11